jgi:HlyD family secretion protein
MIMNQSATPQTKKWRRIIKRAVLLVSLLVIGGGVVVAVMPKPIVVETAKVTRGELIVTIDEDGTSRVRDRYVVSAPLGGNLARINLDTGDQVEQGQILARILPARSPLLDTRTKSEAEARVSAGLAGLKQADAQIERAKAASEYAVQEAKDTAKLAQSNVVSSHELTRAKLEERSAQAELTSAEFSAKVARHQLSMAQAAFGRFDQGSEDGEQFEITSPSAGRILKVMQQSE